MIGKASREILHVTVLYSRKRILATRYDRRKERRLSSFSLSSQAGTDGHETLWIGRSRDLMETTTCKVVVVRHDLPERLVGTDDHEVQVYKRGWCFRS
jgi:hypothetical protein